MDINMELKLKNGYTILSSMTAKEPGGNRFCICINCRDKYPFLKEDIRMFEEEKLEYKEK